MDVPPFPGFREIRMWILQFINTEETSDGTKILNTSVRVHLWHTSVQTFRSSIKWVQQSSLNAFLVHYLRPLKAQLTTNEMQGNIKHYHARCSYKSINLWLKKKKLSSWSRTIWQNSMVREKLKNFSHGLHNVGALSFKTCHRSFSLENAVSLKSSHAAEPCCITMT